MAESTHLDEVKSTNFAGERLRVFLPSSVIQPTQSEEPAIAVKVPDFGHFLMFAQSKKIVHKHETTHI